MGALEVYGKTSTSLIRFLSDSGMNKKEIDFALCKICNVCIPFLIEDYDALYFCMASMVIVPIIVSFNLVIL